MNTLRFPLFISYLTMRESGSSSRWLHQATAVRVYMLLFFGLLSSAAQAQHWGATNTKCNDTTIIATVPSTPAYLGYPVIFCQPSNVLPMHMDSVYRYPCDSMFLTTIVRMWKGLYAPGCTQTIKIKRPVMDSIRFPKNHDGVDSAVVDASKCNTLPTCTGKPIIYGTSLTTNYGWIVSYNDDIHNFKDGTFAIYRKWVAFDTCSWKVKSSVQIILVEDYQAPKITCPQDVTIDCKASLADLSLTGKAIALDNTGIFDLKYKDSTVGSDCKLGIATTRKWIAEDNGGNLASCTQKITQKTTTIVAPIISNKNTTYKDFISKKEKKVALYPNTPNPFSEQTSIAYWLKENTVVRIEVWSVTGGLVYQLNQLDTEGYHSIEITKDMIPKAGVYFYRLIAPIGTETHKMMVE